MARKSPRSANEGTKAHSDRPIGGLTDRQRRFVQEYLVDLNATAAAGRAGYRDTSIGRHLITKKHVAQAIQMGMDARANRVGITADNVLREIAVIAFGDVGLVLDFSGADLKILPANEISSEGRKLIQSIKVKRHLEGTGDEAREVEVTEFKLWDKLAALEKLGRHLKLFTDKHEISGPGGGPVFPELAELLKLSHEELLRIHRETLGLPAPSQN